nr:unknown [Zea mays]
MDPVAGTAEHRGPVEVRARAPGKIILTGEHAVVHGSAAVAAAIDLYTNSSLLLRPAGPGEGGGAGSSAVELDLRDSGLTFSWPCSRLRGALGEEISANPGAPAPCSPDQLAAIARLLQDQDIPEAKIWLSAGLSAFLFLYTSILGCRPGKAVVSSDLPMGAGLGSSAAFCVSMSGALLTAAGAVSVGAHRGAEGWEVLEKGALELVNQWAFQGEKIIHGKPSGIDNSVSTFGKMIKFKKGELTNLESRNPVKMLITDTRVGRNTKALVAGVSERASRHPDAMASVFHAVNTISEELSSIVELVAEDEIAITSKEDKLAELMEMNQGLLQCMGVSHSSIETVLRTTLKYSLVSKLTGAGGGGCVLTLIPTLSSNIVLEKVTRELESHGYRCFKVEVGGRGLQVFRG